MRYFLRLAYRGAPYCGWQRQPNAPSVQQTIEEALAVILRHPAPLTGAGRTDTGVNASEMYAHFDTAAPVTDPERLLRGLNRLCGRDIAIYDLLPVTSDAHARFDATSRTYRYYVCHAKNPFMGSLAWHSPSLLDTEAMNEAAAVLTQVSDFTSFAKLHSDTRTNICDVSYAGWTSMASDTDTNPLICPGNEDKLLVFTITADRFLRNMVRSIVGTLVDVGRGKLTIDGFRQIIEAHDRCAAGTSMPPEPLFLCKIEYPDSIFLTDDNVISSI